MSGFPFGAVMFDLDDTLLRDDLTVSPYTVSTLRRLSDSGVRIIPASGRAKLSMKPFVDLLQCADLYVSCNGAEIWDGGTHELLHAELFSVDLGREIARFGKSHHCYAQTYDGPCFYYNEESEWARRYAESSMLQGVFVGDLEEFIREPHNKILMMDTEENIASMLEEAQDLFRGRVSVTCSKPWFLEFNPVKATKGEALLRAADLLALCPSEFIAFGDSLNDLPMLKTAGKGILMENGRTELRACCDGVCPSNQLDGVAAYLHTVFSEVLS